MYITSDLNHPYSNMHDQGINYENNIRIRQIIIHVTVYKKLAMPSINMLFILDRPEK